MKKLLLLSLLLVLSISAVRSSFVEFYNFKDYSRDLAQMYTGAKQVSAKDHNEVALTCYTHTPSQTPYTIYAAQKSESISVCSTPACTTCYNSDSKGYKDPDKYEMKLFGPAESPDYKNKFRIDFCGYRGIFSYSKVKESSYFNCNFQGSYSVHDCSFDWLDQISCGIKCCLFKSDEECASCYANLPEGDPCKTREYQNGCNILSSFGDSTSYGDYDGSMSYKLNHFYKIDGSSTVLTKGSSPLYFSSSSTPTDLSGVQFVVKTKDKGKITLQWFDVDPCDGPGQYAFPLPQELYSKPASATYSVPRLTVYAYDSLSASAVASYTSSNYNSQQYAPGSVTPVQLPSGYTFAGTVTTAGEIYNTLGAHPYYLYELTIDTDPYIMTLENAHFDKACPCINRNDCYNFISGGSCIATSCKKFKPGGASLSPNNPGGTYSSNKNFDTSARCPSTSDPRYEELYSNLEGCVYNTMCQDINQLAYNFVGCPNNIFGIDEHSYTMENGVMVYRNPACYWERSCTTGGDCIYSNKESIFTGEICTDANGDGACDCIDNNGDSECDCIDSNNNMICDDEETEIDVKNEFGVVNPVSIKVSECAMSKIYTSTSVVLLMDVGSSFENAPGKLIYQSNAINDIVSISSRGFCLKEKLCTDADEDKICDCTDLNTNMICDNEEGDNTCMYDIKCGADGVAAKSIACPTPGTQLCLANGEYRVCNDGEYPRYCFYQPNEKLDKCSEFGCSVLKSKMKSRYYICDPKFGALIEVGDITGEVRGISPLPSKMSAGFKGVAELGASATSLIASEQCVDWQMGQTFKSGFLTPKPPFNKPSDPLDPYTEDPNANTRNPACLDCVYPVCEYPKLDFTINEKVIYFSLDSIENSKVYNDEDELLRRFEGRLTGATKEAANCIQGECIKFDGTDFIKFYSIESFEAVTLPMFLDNGFGFSVGVWIKSNGKGTIFSINSDAGAEKIKLEIKPNGVLELNYNSGVSTGTFEGENSVKDNAWHYIVLAYDSPTSKGFVYVDGVSDISEDGTTPGFSLSYTPEEGDEISFAWDGILGTNLFSGTMDELRIWKRYLAESEVAKITENGIYSISQFPYGETYIEQENLEDRCKRTFGESVGSFCYDDYRVHEERDIRLGLKDGEDEKYCTACISGHKCEYDTVKSTRYIYNMDNEYDTLIFQYNPLKLVPVQMGSVEAYDNTQSYYDYIFPEIFLFPRQSMKEAIKSGKNSAGDPPVITYTWAPADLPFDSLYSVFVFFFDPSTECQNIEVTITNLTDNSKTTPLIKPIGCEDTQGILKYMLITDILPITPAMNNYQVEIKGEASKSFKVLRAAAYRKDVNDEMYAGETYEHLLNVRYLDDESFTFNPTDSCEYSSADDCIPLLNDKYTVRMELNGQEACIQTFDWVDSEVTENYAELICTIPDLGEDYKETCVSGGCYSFLGTNSHIAYSAADSSKVSFSSDFSISFWINGIRSCLDDGCSQAVISVGNDNDAGDGWAIRRSLDVGGTAITFRTPENSVSSNKIVFDDEWHHVVVTFASGSLKLYVNGSQDALGTFSTIPSTQTLKLGAGMSGPTTVSDFYNGRLDEVRFYNRVLTTAEIEDLYALKGLNTETVKYYTTVSGTETSAQLIGTKNNVEVLSNGKNAATTLCIGVDGPFQENCMYNLDYTLVLQPGDKDEDGYNKVLDCDDNNYAIYPGATEICDGVDNNCVGSIDESLTRSCSTACGSGVEICTLGIWVGCTATASVPENTIATCNNGVDDDCDGTKDCADTDCNGIKPTGGICCGGAFRSVPSGVPCCTSAGVTCSAPYTCQADYKCGGV